MTSYTVTITRDDDAATTTTLRLDATSRGVRLTDLHLHAGAGLSGGVLPAIDYGLLLQAVTPIAPTPIEGAPAEGARRRRAAAKQAPAAERVAKAAGGRRTRQAAGRKAARPYRRMPEDLAVVLRRVGGPTAAAEHYKVPRHTVQGWIRTLKAKG
jgi:hypothetical protein